MSYLYVFLIGGGICLIGQILIIRTQMTSARILVLFLLIGVLLQAVGVYEPIAEFAKSGISVPIIGFGAALAKGAIEAVAKDGILGIFLGGLTATATGLAAAVGFAYLFGILFRAKSKRS
ncbi:MAG: SpoVA/SpoVAEb family sporulation membrane protein [Christensenellaceae bacterium]|nr:SpoVA/SpoVAEb family sporulation membrane protein [Christensenellaceae bacterium]